MIYHLTVILLCQLVGEFLSHTFALIVPGPVIGMVLLLALFMMVPKVASAIQPTALGVLSHLSLLFVPAGVGIVGHLDQLGADGLPILAAVLVIITGVMGAVMGSPLLTFLGITDWRARGFALGVASHGIGTARAFQVNETAGAFAGIGMGLNAILTALIAPLIIRLFI